MPLSITACRLCTARANYGISSFVLGEKVKSALRKKNTGCKLLWHKLSLPATCSKVSNMQQMSSSIRTKQEKLIFLCVV